MNLEPRGIVKARDLRVIRGYDISFKTGGDYPRESIDREEEP